MNANELADLMIQFDSSQVWEHAEEIATMLRQQQAEIEALKKQVIGDDFVFVCKRCGDELNIKFGKAQEK